MDELGALLLCGHLLADFVFQTRAMVEGKRARGLWLLAHGLEVFVVQALVLLPFCPAPTFGLLAVTAIAATHMLIDRLKVVLERRQGPRLRWFALDQSLHLAVLVAVLWAWPRGSAQAPLFEADPRIVWWALIAGIYGFNVNGGSAVVTAVLWGLRRAQGSDEPRGALQAGRTIGILERMLVLTLVLLEQWSAIGFVFTAKSVARFKELENRAFSEAYLVGTLTSLLVAGASGLLLRQLIG
jgi:hypothetical protein